MVRTRKLNTAELCILNYRYSRSNLPSGGVKIWRPYSRQFIPTQGAVGMGSDRVDERPLRIEPDRGNYLRPERRKHRGRLCCGFTVAVVVLIVVVLVILGFTVFKAKDPTITVNSVTLDKLDFALGSSGTLARLNVTLNIDLAVKNPNRASFKFGNSTTALYYRGTMVGDAYLPAGKISAHKTVDLRPIATVETDRLASNFQLLSDIMETLNITTSTRLPGRVNVLNIFKHHVVAYASCEVSVSLIHKTIESLTCTHRVKL